MNICSSYLDGPSLLGLSNISVNASMTVHDTALTNATISRLEGQDPIDSLDLSICPADDVLDGCKVHKWPMLFILYKRMALFCNFHPLSSFFMLFFFPPSSSTVFHVAQLYLCGLPLKKLEKLRRLVNTAGGLRFNQPSEELTHVVMGELDQEFTKFLSKAAHRYVPITDNFLRNKYVV